MALPSRSQIRQLAYRLLFLMVFASATSADESAVIKSGQRVRLVCDDTRLGIFSGEIAALGRTGLTVRPNEGVDTLLQVPYHQITKMEVCFGRRGHAATGGLIGFLAPMTIGYIIYKTNHNHLNWHGERFGLILVGTITLGGIVGSCIRTDDWRRVEPKSIRITGGATGHGLGITLAYHF